MLFVIVQMWIFKVELIRIVCTCCPLALEIGLLYNFIMVRNHKLLVRRIGSGNDDLSAA